MFGFVTTHPLRNALPELQSYIERFGEEFAFVLYQWYIDQGTLSEFIKLLRSLLGQSHALLSQDEVYGSLLTKFFDAHDYPELAWMHHIACRRYGEAAAALFVVQANASDLSEKHVS